MEGGVIWCLLFFSLEVFHLLLSYFVAKVPLPSYLHSSGPCSLERQTPCCHVFVVTMVRASRASILSPFPSSFSRTLLWALTMLLSGLGQKQVVVGGEGGEGHLGFFCSWDYLFLYLLYFFCFPDDFCVLLSVSTVTTRCFYGNGKLCTNIYH